MAAPATDRLAGISETFLFPEERYLPEFRYAPVSYPHLNEGEITAALSEEAAEQVEGEDSGWFEAFTDYESVDKTFLNVLIVVGMIVIFVLYRLRSGKKVY